MLGHHTQTGRMDGRNNPDKMNGDMNDATFCDMELLNSEGTFYNDSWRRHSNQQPYGCQNTGFDTKPEFAKDDLEAVVSCSIDLMEDVSSSSSADSQISRRMTLVAANSASSNNNTYNIRNDWSFPVNPQHAFVPGEITQYLNQSLNRFVTVKDEDERQIGCHLPHSGLVEQYSVLPDESKIVPLDAKKKKHQNVICPKDDVFIPVNLLKLLKDVEDDEDDIKQFLESEETKPKEKDTKVFKTSQV